jgi:hypothetical protein
MAVVMVATAANAREMSLLALRYAAGWHDDVSATAGRLYRFNSTPPNPVHSRLYRDPIVGRQLLTAAAGLTRDGRSGGFRLSDVKTSGWLLWRNVDTCPPSRTVGARKLYVTVKLDHMPIAIMAVVKAARSGRVTAFKFGGDYANLRRPDRIVIYTRGRDHVGELAEWLAADLRDIPADQLPFAEPLAAAIFTGLDPPPDPAGKADGLRSWRAWLCRRLAEVLVAQDDTDVASAVDAALNAAGTWGIDPRSWAVPDTFFQACAGGPDAR